MIARAQETPKKELQLKRYNYRKICIIKEIENYMLDLFYYENTCKRYIIINLIKFILVKMR
jgi:hypothetical protein